MSWVIRRVSRSRLLPFLALAVVAAAVGFVAAGAAAPPRAAPPKATPRLISVSTLPPTDLSQFGQPLLTPQALAGARRSGLWRTDLVSVGSGLIWAGGDEFIGTTDRGPNDDHVSSDGSVDGTIFPLPAFTPSLVFFKAAGSRLHVERFLPLTDSTGAGVTGIPNGVADGAAFTPPQQGRSIAYRPGGLDTEAVQRFPDGRFILGEEYGPSLVIASPKGEVLARFVPKGKSLEGAHYPVIEALPAVLAQRRRNRGIESVALSQDGKTAYATLESPLGDPKDPRFAGSRAVRTLVLDVSDPLHVRVKAEHLLLMAPVKEYPGSRNQNDLKLSDAAWVAPGRVLMIERGKGLVKLVLVDYRGATNILGRPEADGLDLEATQDLTGRGIRVAAQRVVMTSSDLPTMREDKLEGLTILGPTVVALINDNDFGIGDNKTGASTQLWKIRLAGALPVVGNGRQPGRPRGSGSPAPR